ncbi:probable 4-coumarate--CoA ligase 3 [Scylla paramamosain]|uniref:probable 4-coumarate--CoA ligase 3 n=1 Tax=Scylla paramamosain TaxID=85552 RepID=UPI0030831B01
MPFFHAWGLYTVLNCSLLQGAKVVTMPTFLPELFLPALAKHQIGVLHVVPPLIQFLVAHPAVTSRDLESLRVVMCAAAPCPAPAAHALKEKAPHPIFFQEAYGMTETMPTHYTPLGHERLGSCGHLLPGVTARVVGAESATPPAPQYPGGAVGEGSWVEVMAGYLNNPEATRDAFTEDGWLRTGDIVTYDEDGYFFVVDRIKELIKVKGHQVSPSEVEGELRALPGVVDAGVVGVADERAGEVPKAFVVRRDPSLTEERVQALIASKLAPHKHLKGGVVFVDELPKSPAGKLLRRLLKERQGE